MKTIKERKNQYAVTALHCLLNHITIFGVMWIVELLMLNDISLVDYDLLSYREKNLVTRILYLRWLIPLYFVISTIIFWRFYFPVKKQLLVFDENGVKVTDPWAYPKRLRRDNIYYFRWAQIKYILFDIVYDDIEIKPTYGKSVRIDFLHFLFFVNFYHMAKAIKEYSGDDDIVIATKPLWHCYLVHGRIKKKETKKHSKCTSPNNRRQIHY